MSYQVKSTAYKSSVTVGLALGLGMNWLIMLIGAAVAAFLILGETVDETAMSTAAVAIMILSSVVGTAAAAKKAGVRRLPVCLASGGLYFLSLLCGNALFFDGSYRGIPAAALTILGCSLVVGLWGLRQKGHKIKGIKRRS